MPYYLITLTQELAASERQVCFWYWRGKNGKKRKFKPEPIKLTWWERVKEIARR